MNISKQFIVRSLARLAFLSLAAVSILAVGSEPLAAQLGPPPKPKLMAFQLKYVDAQSAVATLREILDDSASIVAVSPSQILVNGREDSIDAIREAVELLDQPAQEKADLLKVFTFQHIPVQSAIVQNVAGMFLSKADLVIDERTNSVIVRADAKTQDNIEGLLANLDRPVSPDDSGPLQVRLVWLADGMASDSGQKLSFDLLPLTAELRKIGMGEMQIAAQTILQTSVGARFSLGARTNAEHPAALSLEGSIENLDGNKARIKMSLRANEDSMAAENDPRSRAAGKELAHIDTMIVAPLDHLVVLGASPTGSMTSAFVIQVSRDGVHAAATADN